MAKQDTQLIVLPGRGRVSMPVIRTQKQTDLSGVSKATPEWSVVIGSLTGTIELFGFFYNTTRETLGHSINQLVSSSAPRYSDLVILIQNQTYSPILEQYMNNGSIITVITITRWGWINGTISMLEQRIFSSCYITQYRQVLDYLALFINYREKEEKTIVYSQQGAQTGSVVSSTSATTGAVT
jgi:hypothetical protein